MWWSESRPGRPAGRRWCAAPPTARSPTRCPPPWNARTRVHEYGGGAWTVAGRRPVVHRVRRPAAVPAGAGGRRAGRGHRRAGAACGVRSPTCGWCPAGCSPSGRPTRRPAPRPTSSNEVVRVAADGAVGGAGQRPGLRLRPAPGPGGDAGLAAVGPPDDAVGRRPARRPVRGRHRDVVAGGPGRVRRPAGVGRRRRAAVLLPTAPTSGRCTGGARASEVELGARRRQRPGRAAVAVRAEPAGAAPRRAAGGGRAAGDGGERLAVREPSGELRELRPPGYAAFRVPHRGGGRRGLRRRRPGGRAGGAAGRRSTAGRAEVLRPARDLGLDPAWFSRPEHVSFPTPDGGTGIGDRARAGLPADQPRRPPPRRASCRRCWSSCTAARPPPPSRC